MAKKPTPEPTARPPFKISSDEAVQFLEKQSKQMTGSDDSAVIRRARSLFRLAAKPNKN